MILGGEEEEEEEEFHSSKILGVHLSMVVLFISYEHLCYWDAYIYLVNIHDALNQSVIWSWSANFKIMV